MVEGTMKILDRTINHDSHQKNQKLPMRWMAAAEEDTVEAAGADE